MDNALMSFQAEEKCVSEMLLERWFILLQNQQL